MNTLDPPLGDPAIHPPPLCTGEVVVRFFGDPILDQNGQPVINHGGMEGRNACPFHGERPRQRCTCRPFWLFGGSPHASGCPVGPDVHADRNEP